MIKTGSRDQNAFTLIELAIVLALLSVLAALAAPVVTTSIARAKESALRNNLYVTRSAIDDYFSDNGEYPSDLDVLVEKRYLRNAPYDPLVGSSEDWVVEESDDPEVEGVMDIRSASSQQALDGSYYSEW